MPKTLQTKCKTCFGGPRMILYGFWKNTFLKNLCVLFPPFVSLDAKNPDLNFWIFPLPAALGDSLSCWFWLHSQSQYLLACNQPEEAKCSANKCSYWNDTDMGAAFLLQPWTAILSKMSDWLLIGFLNWKDRIQVWYINNSTKKRLTFVKLASLVRSPVLFGFFPFFCISTC